MIGFYNEDNDRPISSLETSQLAYIHICKALHYRYNSCSIKISFASIRTFLWQLIYCIFIWYMYAYSRYKQRFLLDLYSIMAFSCRCYSCLMVLWEVSLSWFPSHSYCLSKSWSRQRRTAVVNVWPCCLGKR